MSVQDSPSQWYVAGTGSGTVDFPAASHGVTATFASSTMSGRRAVLDFVHVLKIGTADDLIFVDSAGATVFTLSLVATSGSALHRTIYAPNGIEMGSGFGCKLALTDWKFQIGYRFVN